MVRNNFFSLALLGLLIWLLQGCASAPPQTPQTPPPPARPPVAQVPVAPKPPPRLGLALGGGAARGFAHVGVIQVLEANGFRPALVTGTSAGSLVAALYASGMGPKALESAALSMEESSLTDWSLPFGDRGVLRGDALARWVRDAVGGKQLQDLPMPLGVLATDLATGEGILFQRGDTALAVRASSAVPGVFTPVTIGSKRYVDGGLVAPVPVQQARAMGAEVVLAINISSPPVAETSGGVLGHLLQTFTIMGQNINRHELRGAEVVVRPDLDGVGSADFSSRQRAIEAGRRAMAAALPALRRAMAR